MILFRLYRLFFHKNIPNSFLKSCLLHPSASDFQQIPNPCCNTRCRCKQFVPNPVFRIDCQFPPGYLGGLLFFIQNRFHRGAAVFAPEQSQGALELPHTIEYVLLAGHASQLLVFWGASQTMISSGRRVCLNMLSSCSRIYFSPL